MLLPIAEEGIKRPNAGWNQIVRLQKIEILQLGE